MRDVAIVFGKEWLELRRSDSTWVGLSTLLVFVSMVGGVLPWLVGPLWVTAPWVALLWAWIPMFLVTTVTADSFAGERERRTLETLLATRLTDGAILWGKWLAGVVWVGAAMALCLPVSLVTLNIAFAPGPFLPSFAHALGTVAVVFAASGFGGALGVLISMRAASVRHAQQVLAIAVFMIAFVPIAALRVLPPEWTGRIFQTLNGASPGGTAWLVAAILVGTTLPVLVTARARFRRGRLPLK